MRRVWIATLLVLGCAGKPPPPQVCEVHKPEPKKMSLGACPIDVDAGPSAVDGGPDSPDEGG